MATEEYIKESEFEDCSKLFEESDETEQCLRTSAPSFNMGNNKRNMDLEENTPEEHCCTSFCEQIKGENPVTKYCTNFWTKKNLLRKLPILTWGPKYRLKHFAGDLVAGLTVGLTVIPQGLAYAAIAGLPPQYGLYSAFMGVFVYMFLGTSKDVTLGPTAIMSLMVYEFGSHRAPDEESKATYAVVLTLFVGLIQVVMGLLNLGFIVQFISFPVISGFSSAAAIIIAFSQIKKLFGLTDVDGSFIEQFGLTFKKLPETHLPDMGLGFTCIAVLIAMKYLKEFIDRRMKTEKNKGKKAIYKIIWITCTARNAVIVLIAAAIAAALKDIYGIDELTLTKNVVEGVPTPALPRFTISHTDTIHNDGINSTLISNLTTTISSTTTDSHHGGDSSSTASGIPRVFSDIGEGFFVVALIGLLESIAIAKSFARRNEYQVDSSQELIALGMANTISSFFHSYPVTGSFSRTAINSQSGVRTPAGGLWTGGLILIALAVLTPYFTYIPQSALAGVIIAAVLPMVEYEVIPHFWKIKKLDLVPLFITFILCILVNIEIGIAAGVAFSILVLVFPMARPTISYKYEKLAPKKFSVKNGEIEQEETQEAIVLEPNQGLKFPAIEYIKDKSMKFGVYETPARAVILNAIHISGTDFTTVQGIRQLAEYFDKHKLHFVIATCNEEFKSILDNAEITQLNIAPSVPDALELISAHGASLDTASTSSAGEANSAFDGSEISSRASDQV